MSKQNNKAAISIQDLRYKMAQKFADLENGEITVAEAKAFTGIATVIVKTCQIEYVNNESAGLVNSIDFLVEENRRSSKKLQDGTSNADTEKLPDLNSSAPNKEDPDEFTKSKSF